MTMNTSDPLHTVHIEVDVPLPSRPSWDLSDPSLRDLVSAAVGRRDFTVVDIRHLTTRRVLDQVAAWWSRAEGRLVQSEFTTLRHAYIALLSILARFEALPGGYGQVLGLVHHHYRREVLDQIELEVGYTHMGDAWRTLAMRHWSVTAIAGHLAGLIDSSERLAGLVTTLQSIDEREAIVTSLRPHGGTL